MVLVSYWKKEEISNRAEWDLGLRSEEGLSSIFKNYFS